MCSVAFLVSGSLSCCVDFLMARLRGRALANYGTTIVTLLILIAADNAHLNKRLLGFCIVVRHRVGAR